MFKKLKPGLFVGALALLLTQAAAAEGYKRIYEVSITNITKGQTFTPQLVTTHTNRVSLFEVGEAANDELATLAESGNTGPMTALLQAQGIKVADAQTIGGLLGPGQTATISVEAFPFTRRLSVAAMLIPTNDTFVGGDALRLPRRGSSTFYLQAYDSGTEFNDQNCLNIPGPRCGGEGDSAPAATDEGFVHISNGFHDLGTQDAAGNEILGPFTYDWRNPVAKVVVKRIY